MGGRAEGLVCADQGARTRERGPVSEDPQYLTGINTGDCVYEDNLFKTNVLMLFLGIPIYINVGQTYILFCSSAGMFCIISFIEEFIKTENLQL